MVLSNSVLWAPGQCGHLLNEGSLWWSCHTHHYEHLDNVGTCSMRVASDGPVKPATVSTWTMWAPAHCGQPLMDSSDCIQSNLLLWAPRQSRYLLNVARPWRPFPLYTVIYVGSFHVKSTKNFPWSLRFCSQIWGNNWDPWEMARNRKKILYMLTSYMYVWAIPRELKCPYLRKYIT